MTMGPIKKGGMKSNLKDLIQQLDTQGDLAAEKVIEKLVNFGATAVPELLIAAKNKETPRLRKWSLLALGSLKDKRAVPLLLAALDDERMTVQLQALGGLARMRYKKAAKKIAGLLKNKRGGVRGRALRTLIILNEASIAKQILPSLQDPMWYIRQEACIACGHFKIKSARLKLTNLAKNDERKAVREAAAEALAQLNR
jgi:HEAT repeat protein